MESLHNKRFPGESDTYRQARNALLQQEREYRKRLQALTDLRQQLPLGGQIPEDYVFDEMVIQDQSKTVKQTRFSELFATGKNSLVIYSFMYDPDWEKPCRSCNSILDGLDGSALHIEDCVNLVVVAKAPIDKLYQWGQQRGWKYLRLLSSANNRYNADYFAETPEGNQIPALNVFRKTDEGIFHFYNTELLYSPSEEGQEPRHIDQIWPLWNVFDLTPDGRRGDWHPQYAYE